MLVAASTAASLVGCGGGEPPPSAPARRELAPQWQDVFDGTPDLYAVLRPQALRRDAVYGPLFKNLMRVAQARTAMRGVTALEVLEGCDELILGVRKDADGDDAAIVFRGVPASLDPARMTDEGGRPLFRRVETKSLAQEYEWSASSASGAAAGTLFVLPERTWVVVMGGARLRAREAFTSPFGRPVPRVDPTALATARFEAASFLGGARASRLATFAQITKKLRSVTLSLQPGKSGFTAALQYEDEDAAAWAEMHAKQILDAVASARPPAAAEAGGTSRGAAPPAGRLDWLKTARLAHEGNVVTVQMEVPLRLLEELPRVTSGDLSF